MATRKAIDLVKKSSTETLLLRCHVRPGASKVREGVTEITDDAVELCVAAQAQDGKANKAVVEILSEVRYTYVPESPSLRGFCLKSRPPLSTKKVTESC